MPIQHHKNGSLASVDGNEVKPGDDNRLLGNRRNTYHHTKKQGPLFPHIPAKNDINQRRVGDCVLLSTIICILNFNVDDKGDPIDNKLPAGPDIIQNMLIEQKEHVTVRLYEANGAKAEYFRVDKSIPIKVQRREFFRSTEFPALSEGPLWVPMLEKAYAVKLGDYAGLQGLMHQNTVLNSLLGGESDVIRSREQDSATQTDRLKSFTLLMSTSTELKERGTSARDIKQAVNTFFPNAKIHDLHHPWWRVFDEEKRNAWLSFLAEKGAPKMKGNLGPLEIPADLLEVKTKLENDPTKLRWLNYVKADSEKDKDDLAAAIFGNDAAKLERWWRFYTKEQRDIWWRKGSDPTRPDRMLAGAAEQGIERLRFEQVDTFFRQHIPEPHQTQIVAMLARHQLFPGKMGTARYSRRQLDLYTQIEHALQEGRCVLAGTRAIVAEEDESENAQDGTMGLTPSHSYAVLDCQTADKIPSSELPGRLPQEMRFVKLRNPVGALGVKLERGGREKALGRKYVWKDRGDGVKVLIAVEKETPEFWLELTDLDRHFGLVTASPIISDTKAYQEAKALRR